MKTLFVCKQNVGRSQAAMELWRLKGSGETGSAGSAVDSPDTTLAERPGAVNIVNIMREDYGVDMIQNVRKQITKELAAPYDRLIVMAQPETWPEWLRTDPRVTYWEVEDTLGHDVPTTRRIVKEIEAQIDDELRK